MIMGALLDKHADNVGQAYSIFSLILQGLYVHQLSARPQDQAGRSCGKLILSLRRRAPFRRRIRKPGGSHAYC